MAARVGRILKTLPLPTTTTVRIVRTLDWDCVDAIVDCNQIIVVDALDSGQEPGTCFIEEVLQDDAPTFRLYCRHRDLVKDIVALAHLVGMEGSPKRVVIVGVETGGARWDESSDATAARSAVSLAVDSGCCDRSAPIWRWRRMVPNAMLAHRICGDERFRIRTPLPRRAASAAVHRHPSILAIASSCGLTEPRQRSHAARKTGNGHPSARRYIGKDAQPTKFREAISSFANSSSMKSVPRRRSRPSSPSTCSSGPSTATPIPRANTGRG